MPKQPWTSQFKPKNINDLILPQKIKETILNMKAEEQICNLLFHGKPGNGKSTTAALMCNSDSLFVNCIAHNTAKAFETIDRFCSTKPMDDLHKVLILDEGDCLKAEYQARLKSIMDQHNHHVQFIMTTNYPKTLLPALTSRFHMIDFDFTLTEKLLQKIEELVMTACSSDDSLVYDKAITRQTVKALYPDMRQILNNLQFNLRE